MSMDYRKYMDDDNTCERSCERHCGRRTCERKEETLTDQEIAALADLIFTALTDCLRDEAVTRRCEKLGELRKKYGEDARLVILADPAKGYRICTEEASLDAFLEDDAFEPGGFEPVFDEELFINYDEEDVVVLGGRRYLTGPMVIFEIDEDGNECSITPDTIKSFFDFTEASRTLIEVDGKNFPAFRLD